MTTTDRTVAWFHCFSGVAGDMALGSLVDAGADIDEVRGMCRRLPLGGWSLEAEPVLRGGIAGTKVHVRAEQTSVVRTAAHIVGLVEEARLPRRIRSRALATFGLLAEVEGRLHRRPPSQVHFHEVGGVDAIVDIVGTCAALEVLGVDEVTASSIATGSGLVRAQHGILPNPAPAVVELLRGAPTHGLDIDVELTTPTGAALLAANVTTWGPMPAMRVESSGFGAGTRELEGRPNLTQVVVGTRMASSERGQAVTLLEANLDDATGEVLAHAVEALLGAGAHDAWITPILMKKGRPGHVLSVLVDPAGARRMADLLTSETGSLGIRGLTFERWPAARSFDEVEVEGLAVRVKVTAGRAKVEYDDAARVASVLGLPVREVLSRAEQAWRSSRPENHLRRVDGGRGVVEQGPWFGSVDGPDDEAG